MSGKYTSRASRAKLYKLTLSTPGFISEKMRRTKQNSE
jgi:hypothetical protein